MKNGEIELKFFRPQDEIAYIFKKSLNMDVFKKLKMMFSLVDFKAWFKGGC